MAPRILVVGATSAIAHAVARRYARRGAAFALLGRRETALQANADDLRVRGAASVHVGLLDANDIAAHARVLDAASAACGGFDIALIAHGSLPDQARCEASVEEALAAFDTNGRSVIALLTLLANRFEAQGRGV